MAEEQGKIGEEWNRRLNAFLSKIFGWRQMGDSGNDIFCEELSKTVGMDSVFSYRNNRNSPQQIVFVEAKTRQDMKGINKSSIEEMVDVMLEKLEFAPCSIDFRKKYLPDGSAEYNKGLIGFWIRGEYSSEKFSKVLSEIQPPRKSISQNIFIVSNDRLSFLYEVHLTKGQFERKDYIKDLRYFFPHYSEKPACDGEGTGLLK